MCNFATTKQINIFNYILKFYYEFINSITFCKSDGPFLKKQRALTSAEFVANARQLGQASLHL